MIELHLSMFTGIVTAVGRVHHLEGGGARLAISAPPVILQDLEVGGSIAVSGVCLTATSVDPAVRIFTADLSPETRGRTTLGALQEGDLVNLELPLRPRDRLGGHFVQGHVDTVGEVVAIEPQSDGNVLFTFRVDPQYDSLIVEKGSIAIDGISLTPFCVQRGAFKVAVVPHTFRVTALRALRPGAKVNVEFDILAKYVAKQLQARLEAG
jgi:riboflavin synthase